MEGQLAYYGTPYVMLYIYIIVIIIIGSSSSSRSRSRSSSSSIIYILLFDTAHLQNDPGNTACPQL
jgi:hypothetical protein